MPPRSAPTSLEGTAAWMKRVHEVQNSLLTPERREELKAQVEAARVRECQSRKCKTISHNAVRTNALAREGLRQMASVSAPGEYLEVTARWHSAQMASEARQDHFLARLEASKSAGARVEEAEEDDEAEALAEVAHLVGTGDPNLLAMDSAAAMAADMRSTASGEASLEALLAQVKVEPEEVAECAAKFQLYEGYGQQVEKIRKLLFDFYEESKPTVPVSVGGDMERQVKHVDNYDAMAVPDDDGRVWFVYHMMRVAERNNRTMAGILEDFERKLELLAKNDQTECPVCLEAFTEAGGPHAVEILSCCHKICRECWENWKQVTRGQPFCPLCRHDEFLGVVASHVHGE